jgi:hypothetical protein
MTPFSSRLELCDGLRAEAFCSYCGYPLKPAWHGRLPRVCTRCRLGMVLRTVPDGAPHRSDPFVIVDEQLTVRAISRQAEAVLMVDEPAGVGVPLDEFLVSDNGDHQGAEVAQVIALATGGAPPPLTVALRTAGDPEARFKARITSCGPPLAALLVLTTTPDEKSRSGTATVIDAPGGESANLTLGAGAA